ncbi:MAG: phytoene/squalene synthase family protein [Rhodobacteraceae bacterium]|nr:phytoene/squalene synthase family protein [Paracoccaceae bacterium]
MTAAADLAACAAAIRTGSHSFHAAARLLPAGVRAPALALYAFCRCADDAVDCSGAEEDAVQRLRERLDRVYRGQPADAPADRAFSAAVAASGLPRILPEALIEGFAWDAAGRRYATMSEVRAYAARVAAAVGAMMCVLMGVRSADALARACDLGVAMQLTNIARDVGEDAAAGRLYLPLDWLAAEGLDPESLLARPEPSPALGRVVRRLLLEADRLYFRAEPGIAALPPGARPGVWAARLIYAGIGRAVARAGFDSVTRRARTGRAAKLGWLAAAAARSGMGLVLPQSPVLYAPPLAETAFLVEAAAREAPLRAGWPAGRGGSLLAALAQLEATDRARRTAAS